MLKIKILTLIDYLVRIILFFVLCSCGRVGIDSSCKEQKDLLFEGVCLPVLFAAPEAGSDYNKSHLDACLLLQLSKSTCKD